MQKKCKIRHGKIFLYWAETFELLQMFKMTVKHEKFHKIYAYNSKLAVEILDSFYYCKKFTMQCEGEKTVKKAILTAELNNFRYGCTFLPNLAVLCYLQDTQANVCFLLLYI